MYGGLRKDLFYFSKAFFPLVMNMKLETSFLINFKTQKYRYCIYTQSMHTIPQGYLLNYVHSGIIHNSLHLEGNLDGPQLKNR